MPIVTICLCWDWNSGKRVSFRHVNNDGKTNIPPEIVNQKYSYQNGDNRAQKPLVEDKIG